ncbi:MAG: hypothetical protein KDD02_15605 [Phaeodactylibacter sp.]|nr:hypothetical protein [Phaeodactylibacter sp.]MCB9304138.1 hypothetical protein [Lewinellaceae bacterium]
MFTVQKDQLFTLIKSLTKAEKRSFRLYVNRFQSAGDTKFLQLFDVLDRLSEYDEELVLKRLPEVEKRHLSNLKRHLYKQILTSLRLIYIQKNIDIQIREQLDFARILYGKGMYMQSLRILERIKKTALEHHQDILHLEILEFEKMIEARHITRSRKVENKMEGLLEEAAHRSYVTHYSNLFSNFNIQMHGWYIVHGHAKNEGEEQAVQEFFERNMPQGWEEKKLTFFEKANWYQSKMWYHYIRLDFELAAEQARQWVELFHTDEQMKQMDPDLYMRALYYLLVLLYLMRSREEFAAYLHAFEAFEREFSEQMNDNSRMIVFVYLNLSRLNYSLLERDFKGGILLAKRIEQELPEHEAYMDAHRSLLFYFKFAYLFFSDGQCEKALEYLNEIIHLKSAFLREDLHFNARLLHLLCHYELEHYDLLDYLISSVQRQFHKGADISELHQNSLRFLRQLTQIPLAGQPDAFRQFQRKLKNLQENKYESKALNYLDIPAWVEGHVPGVKVGVGE